MYLGDSVQYSFLHLFLHFHIVFRIHRIQYRAIYTQNPVCCSRKPPHHDIFAKRLACSCWVPPANITLAKGTTGLHCNTMYHDREHFVCLIEEISIHLVRFLLLAPPVGSVQYKQFTANLHWVGVEIIQIWNTLPPVVWCFRRGIYIEPGGV
jgi:hypothetical protein